MELSFLENHEGERPRVGPALVRRLVDETSGLERVLARREEALGAALERDLFPDGPPARVLPVDVRVALAGKLQTALHVWAASPGGAAGAGDELMRPLRAIAAQVGSADSDDEMHSYLFPAGVPERVRTTDLLRAFRHAAAREQRSLVRLASLAPVFGAHGTLIEHELAGRAVLVVRLWVIALKWYALAAGRAGTTHARSFHALTEKWKRVEGQMKLCIDA
ncbi:hypothetical protein [Sandaracinus amylolyticus]|uniref:hypothetical protein n=1 Tax=Sandaracinus amylolyticus TaxID=927083 RepID=UPI001F1E5E0B|nr:hypothetical protein [Sandaracinus amylolyticus]UJR82258.1 Hypothetical protein I5071_43230 [Sandaracinus amylolyticus]